MAASDRPNDGAWSELETRFFAGAPPDVPEPPPEPMRFDDLDPIPRPHRERRLRLRRAHDRALVARGGVRFVFARVGRRSAPALVWARTRAARLSTIAWRRLVRAMTAVGDAGIREGRRMADRFFAGLPTASKDRRAILAASGVLILVMGLSAGVVASRGAGRLPLPTTTMAVLAPTGFGGTAICQPPPESESPADAAPAPSPPARAIGIGVAKPAQAAVKRHRSHKRLAAVAPAKSNPSVSAIGSAKPSASAKAVGSAKPSASAKPIASAKPTAPTKPAAPSKIVAPAKPTAPPTPAASTKSAPSAQPQPPKPVAPAPPPAPARRPIFSR